MNRRSYGSIVALAALSGCTAVPGGSTADEVGETYTTEAGVDLTVDRVETQREGSVVLDGDTPLTTKSGASGFLLTHLVATNTTETPVEPPAPEVFRLHSGGEQQDTYQEDFADAPGGAGSRISEPVSGPLFPAITMLKPGTQTDGWFVFSLPDGGSATLELLVDGEPVTSWSVPL